MTLFSGVALAGKNRFPTVATKATRMLNTDTHDKNIAPFLVAMRLSFRYAVFGITFLFFKERTTNTINRMIYTYPARKVKGTSGMSHLNKRLNGMVSPATQSDALSLASFHIRPIVRRIATAGYI